MHLDSPITTIDLGKRNGGPISLGDVDLNDDVAILKE